MAEIFYQQLVVINKLGIRHTLLTHSHQMNHL